MGDQHNIKRYISVVSLCLFSLLPGSRLSWITLGDHLSVSCMNDSHGLLGDVGKLTKVLERDKGTGRADRICFSLCPSCGWISYPKQDNPSK